MLMDKLEEEDIDTFLRAVACSEAKEKDGGEAPRLELESGMSSQYSPAARRQPEYIYW